MVPDESARVMRDPARSGNAGRRLLRISPAARVAFIGPRSSRQPFPCAHGPRSTGNAGGGESAGRKMVHNPARTMRSAEARPRDGIPWLRPTGLLRPTGSCSVPPLHNW